MQRPSGRAPAQLRDISITRNFTRHAEGSVLVCFGDTRVICTASVEQGVPRFLRGSGSGWVTAEYGMLPRSTGSRMGRDRTRVAMPQGPVVALSNAQTSYDLGTTALMRDRLAVPNTGYGRALGRLCMFVVMSPTRHVP